MRPIFGAVFLFLVLNIGYAIAQTYPQRPVTIVVPYATGGSTDAIIRPAQDKISSLLGQPVIVENRPGASGNIGGAYVARSNPDGYTLLLQSTIIGMYGSIFPNMTYDPLKDYEPITSLAESPTLFVVRGESPFKSLADFAAGTKDKPQGLLIGNSGIGSPAHLAAVQLAKLNNFNLTHVTYRGSGPLVLGLLSKQVDIAVVSLGGISGQLESGEVRALAVASSRRSTLVPTTPTTAEAGFAPMKASVRFFLAAPNKTEDAVVERLSSAFQSVMNDKYVSDRIKQAGFEIIVSSREEARNMLHEQNEIWSPLVKELNINLE